MGALFSNTQIPALLVGWDGAACGSSHTWALLHAENNLALPQHASRNTFGMCCLLTSRERTGISHSSWLSYFLYSVTDPENSFALSVWQKCPEKEEGCVVELVSVLM